MLARALPFPLPRWLARTYDELGLELLELELELEEEELELELELASAFLNFYI